MNQRVPANQLDVGGDVHELALVFKALSDENRLRILRLTGPEAPPGGLCVMALARALGISQPAVSQHLAVLRACGLIVPQRRGYFIHCRLNRPRLEACRQAMAEFFGLDRPLPTAIEATPEPAPVAGECCEPASTTTPDDCCVIGHSRPHHRRGRRQRCIKEG